MSDLLVIGTQCAVCTRVCTRVCICTCEHFHFQSIRCIRLTKTFHRGRLELGAKSGSVDRISYRQKTLKYFLHVRSAARTFVNAHTERVCS